MLKKWLLMVGLGWLVVASGCVSVPAVSVSREIGTEELSGHVYFLAQPKLKGRKPMSYGSRVSRAYIEAQFEAIGLKPWGKAKGFSQPFLLGTNVVGVLPGSDSDLAREVVIVCAHFDHLGKTRDQGLCLGACDNASGVAALLEMAESLVLRSDRPRRTICFAAFDQEESGLLGAFSFAGRKDFDPNQVAGVVNVDLLGRKGLEVLDRHLFLSGTETYRELRREIQAAVQNGIEILPAGTDIVGPRGDHVAFEGLGFPALFYSCGLYKEYHREGDTPDKLDYDLIRSSASVIEKTVVILANADSRFESVKEDEGDREELHVFDLCLDRLLQGENVWALTESDVNALNEFSQKVKQHLASETYTPLDRERLIRKAALTLFPVISHFEPQQAQLEKRFLKAEDPNALALAEKRLLLLEMLELRSMIGQSGRDMVRQMPASKLAFIWPQPERTYKKSVVPNAYMNLDYYTDGTLSQLAFVVFEGSVSIKWPGLLLAPWSKPLEIGVNHMTVGLFGGAGDIVDKCLLLWKEQRVKNPQYDTFMPSIMNRVTQQAVEPNILDSWIAYRLAEQGYADQGAWYEQLIQDPNQHLTKLAINGVNESDPKYILQALVRTLEDDRPVRQYIYSLHLPEDHPIHQLKECVKTYIQLLPKPDPKPKRKTQKPKPKPAPKTIGDLALKKLKDLTHQDFGKDAQAWQDWIESHWKV